MGKVGRGRKELGPEYMNFREGEHTPEGSDGTRARSDDGERDCGTHHLVRHKERALRHRPQDAAQDARQHRPWVQGRPVPLQRAIDAKVDAARHVDPKVLRERVIEPLKKHISPTVEKTFQS